MTTEIGRLHHSFSVSSRAKYGPRSPTQPIFSSNLRPAASTMPACAATIRSPQTVAMSRPSWKSRPFTSREPHGDGPNGSVIRPFGSGHTYPSRRDGAGGGAQVWTRRRSGLAGRPATGPDTIVTGAAGEAPPEGALGEGGSEDEAG